MIVFNHKYVILKYFEIFYCKDARNLKFFQTDLKAWWDEVTRKEGTQNIWTMSDSEWGRHTNCVTFPCCGMLRLLWELSHSSYSRVVLYKLYNCLKILPSSQPHLSVYMPELEMMEGRALVSNTISELEGQPESLTVNGIFRSTEFCSLWCRL